MYRHMKLSLFVFLVLFTFGCTHTLTIHQPLEGAVFSESATIDLEAEIRGGESGCGGDDCNCADWWWTSGGAALGLDKSNDTEVSFCRYTWTLPASNLGVGNHTLQFHADQTNYRETTESVQITVQP